MLLAGVRSLLWRVWWETRKTTEVLCAETPITCNRTPPYAHPTVLPQPARAVDLDGLPEHFTARDMRIAGRANPKSRIAHVLD